MLGGVLTGAPQISVGAAIAPLWCHTCIYTQSVFLISGDKKIIVNCNLCTVHDTKITAQKNVRIR